MSQYPHGQCLKCHKAGVASAVIVADETSRIITLVCPKCSTIREVAKGATANFYFMD